MTTDDVLDVRRYDTCTTVGLLDYYASAESTHHIIITTWTHNECPQRQKGPTVFCT